MINKRPYAYEFNPVKATKKDADEIYLLYKTMSDEPCDWDDGYPGYDTIKFDMERNALYVMKDESGKIVATISMDDDPLVDGLLCWTKSLLPGGEFSRICVRKDMRGMGIAKKMVKFILDKFKKKGLRSSHILVRPKHIVAINLYEKMGFKKVGECSLFDKNFICMEKEL